jgi:precorrin-6A/cobalt-precorrin-6A reductase
VIRVLILGGTGEARALAGALEGDARFAATLSLAGVTQAPHRPALAIRIGGFGGANGLARWLTDNRIDALIDATHPFAQQISANAIAAAAQADVAMLRIARPAWEPVAGDRWSVVPDMAAAAAALGPQPRRVLLTIGRKDLAPFSDHPHHNYVVRSVDAPPPAWLPPRCVVLAARGPFTIEHERALLADKAIDVLVTKNSGGDATAAKLVAARERGLRVVMIARPEPVAISGVAVWQSALSWLEQRHQDAATLRAV